MRKLRLFAAALGVITVASCGGETSTPSQDAEFCDYLRTLEDLDPDAAPDNALAAIDEIIDRAPKGEIKGALQDLRPIFEAMSTIDPNDEAAFGEIMGVMFDPKVVAAGEVLEKYGEEVCGFSDADTTTGDTSGWTSSPENGVEPSALEDLESSDISGAVEAVLSDLAPRAYVASSGWSSSGDGFDVEVDISGTDDVDGVPLCEAVVDLLSRTDPNAQFTVSITLDGKGIATSNLDNCLGLIR